MIAGTECEFNSDFRDIIKIFEPLTDPDLLNNEKVIVSLDMFYKTDDYKKDLETAIKDMFFFIDMGDTDSTAKHEKPVYDWNQDFNIIVAPVSRIIGKDVRGMEYLHWWSFLNAFMEIGECTFSTYVSIRSKLNKGKKLEKYEEKIFRENKNKVLLKKKVDTFTQNLLDEVLGV